MPAIAPVDSIRTLLLLGGCLILAAPAGAQAPTLPSDTLEANYAPPSVPGPTPELSPSLPSDTLEAVPPVPEPPPEESDTDIIDQDTEALRLGGLAPAQLKSWPSAFSTCRTSWSTVNGFISSGRREVLSPILPSSSGA